MADETTETAHTPNLEAALAHLTTAREIARTMPSMLGLHPDDEKLVRQHLAETKPEAPKDPTPADLETYRASLAEHAIALRLLNGETVQAA